MIVFSLIFVVFRFGGALSYTNSINWESAARLNSNLLNETILDDAQALYRIKSITNWTSELEDIHLTPAELHEKIQSIGGNPSSTRFDEAFTKTITTERLQQQPQSINIILSESYGLWPFLAEFNEPGAYLVEQGRKYAASPQAMGTQMALAQGTGTMPAIIGLLTGMPDTGMYPNYNVGILQEPYGLGIGPVMKKLGYKTVFWYGGFSTWQNVKNFALEQGFDEFHDASEMPSDEENAWGVADSDMFKAINAYMDKHRGEKIINIIMTTSNHPPYSVNIAKEGYDADKVRRTCQIPLRIQINKLRKWVIFGMQTMCWANLLARRNKLIQQLYSSSPVTTANALPSLVRKVLRWPPRFQLFSTVKGLKKNGFHQTHSA